MQRHYRDILKHSSIYGLGQILSRLASFLLLPLYTRYLSPADYGCIAILDLTATILSILIGSGMRGAVNRYHFRAGSEAEQDRVWWSGLAVLALTASAIVVPAWLAREGLARSLLGPGFPRGELFFSLALPTLWLNSIRVVPESHLRVRKQSGLSVALALGRLLVNIALNVYFLVAMGMGVTGILLGNLVTAVLAVITELAIFRRTRGPCLLDRSLMVTLWRYSWPMALSGLMMTVMQQADRYMLRLFCGMDEVGIYSLAATIGRAVFLLCFEPFNRIWGVTLHEIAEQPEAKRIYSSVFRYTFHGGLLLILGVALFARPLIGLMVTEDYEAAADLIPIVSLAYLFLHLAAQFNVPIWLTSSTVRVMPSVAVAIGVNIGANLLFIPRIGTVGAAAAAVVSFAAYAAMCLCLSRSIMKIDYPLIGCGSALLTLIGIYLGYRYLEKIVVVPWAQFLLATTIWIGATAALIGPLIGRVGRIVRFSGQLQLLSAAPRIRAGQEKAAT